MLPVLIRVFCAVLLVCAGGDLYASGSDKDIVLNSGSKVQPDPSNSISLSTVTLEGQDFRDFQAFQAFKKQQQFLLNPNQGSYSSVYPFQNSLLPGNMGIANPFLGLQMQQLLMQSQQNAGSQLSTPSFLTQGVPGTVTPGGNDEEDSDQEEDFEPLNDTAAHKYIELKDKSLSRANALDRTRKTTENLKNQVSILQGDIASIKEASKKFIVQAGKEGRQIGVESAHDYWSNHIIGQFEDRVIQCEEDLNKHDERLKDLTPIQERLGAIAEELGEYKGYVEILLALHTRLDTRVENLDINLATAFERLGKNYQEIQLLRKENRNHLVKEGEFSEALKKNNQRIEALLKDNLSLHESKGDLASKLEEERKSRLELAEDNRSLHEKISANERQIELLQREQEDFRKIYYFLKGGASCACFIGREITAVAYLNGRIPTASNLAFYSFGITSLAKTAYKILPTPAINATQEAVALTTSGMFADGLFLGASSLILGGLIHKGWHELNKRPVVTIRGVGDSETVEAEQPSVFDSWKDSQYSLMRFAGNHKNALYWGGMGIALTTVIVGSQYCNITHLPTAPFIEIIRSGGTLMKDGILWVITGASQRVVESGLLSPGVVKFLALGGATSVSQAKLEY